tara:strand:+ start:1372 stop:1902 length:531 start_codon:yes stop_codon:yes gene_type:complete
MKKKKIYLNKGILFWVTGLSGSGKTTISRKIKKYIEENYGPTLLVSGDDIRNIFNFKKYTIEERRKLVLKYCKFSKFITDQNINLIFAVVGMMDEVRDWNKKNIRNYIEIFIKTDLKKIIKNKKKKIYHKKNIGDIVGLDIQPEFPKKPDIIIYNDFKNKINSLSKDLIKKINKII